MRQLRSEKSARGRAGQLWQWTPSLIVVLALTAAPALPQGTLERSDIKLKRSPALGQLQEMHNISGLTISDRGVFTVGGAAEIVAAVIPPGRKRECSAGRLLVSLDNKKNPGRILGRDLDALNGATTDATFSGYTKTLYWNNQQIGLRRILSNDQDLVTLNNGDVLYVRMGQTTKAIPTMPQWFAHAYKIPKTGDPWGPGARSEVLVFRSSDCGRTFHMVSTLDTAALDDGFGTLDDWSGGLPQTCGVCPQELPSGKNAWQMGGTDGPLTTVDRKNGHVYISIGIVGNIPEAGSGGDFELSSQKVSRTVVMSSIDNGSTWQRAAVLPYKSWRSEIVPMDGNLLAFGSGRSTRRLHIGQYGADGTSVVDGTPVNLPGTSQAWTTSSDVAGSHLTGLRGQSILTGLPGSGGTLLLVRDTHDGTPGGTKGYRAYTYDWSSSASAFLELTPAILPQKPGRANFVFNPVAVDLGAGPVFVYWYDVTTDIKVRNRPQSVKIRGRIILGPNLQTDDFTIRSAFEVVDDRFYGHYQMAGGYRTEVPATGYQKQTYFPVWIEVDGYVHFARVEYSRLGPPDLPITEIEHQLPTGIFRVPEANRIEAVRTERLPETSIEEREEYLEEENTLETRALEPDSLQNNERPRLRLRPKEN